MVASVITRTIQVFLNGGDAAFSFPRVFPMDGFPLGEVPLAVTTGDVDGDGLRDVIVTLGEGDDRIGDQVAVLLNLSAIQKDCNRNAVPDSCDIANGGSRDDDQDGIPDECEHRLNFAASNRFTEFHRGDPNADGAVEISDAIATLSFLFLRDEPLDCREAADFDNDGRLDISDPIALLSFLFLGGRPPASPGPSSASCGLDPDPPGSPGHMDCWTYTRC